MILFQTANLQVRKLTDNDVEHLVKWLSDPIVLQYYGGRDRPHDIETVREVFFPHEDSETRCIVEYDYKPIGYIQFYELEDEGKKKYGYSMEEKVYGTDQFIGEVHYWNKGIGKLMVGSMVEYLITVLNAGKIVMDPQICNVRAILCYEKCGFKKVRLLPRNEWHEGELKDCWQIEYSKRS